MSEIAPIKEHTPTFEELATPTRLPANKDFSDVAPDLSTVDALKKNAPEAFWGIMESMAREACRQSKKSSDRIRAAMKEGEDRS